MPKVLVIYTGGTIGMVPADGVDPLSPLVPAPLYRLADVVAFPLDGVDWQLRGLEDGLGGIVDPLDSSSVGPAHWQMMAEMVARHYDAYDGFVILHGTDTMAYGGAALAFLLENLAKPVVLAGSQQPLSAPGSDARTNLANAIRVAGRKPAIAEVLICFGDRLLRACAATKVSTWAPNGFDSPNHSWLGRLLPTIEIEGAALRPPTRAPLTLRTGFDEGVAVLTLTPGLGAAGLGALLATEAMRGFVLRAYGAGNAPDEPDLLDKVRQATKLGKPVVVTSQCSHGSVDMGRYQAGQGLARAGALASGPMTPEAATVKLMWLLAQGGAEAVTNRWAENIRGELG
jgi:L-asparaginase